MTTPRWVLLVASIALGSGCSSPARVAAAMLGARGQGPTDVDVRNSREPLCRDTCGDRFDSCTLFCGSSEDPAACTARCQTERDLCLSDCVGPPTHP